MNGLIGGTEALIQERDELAAQIEVMRGMLIAGRPKYGAVGSRDDEVTARQQAFDEALALPNTDAILRQRDARTLESALNACRNDPCENYTVTLRNLIYELEKQHG